MRVYYDRDADLNIIKSKKVAIAYAELPALEVVKEKYKAAAKDVGLDVVAELPYSAVGMTDWTPLAQSIINSGAGTLMWVGEAGNVTSAMAKLKEQGWKGHALLETNMYDPLLFSQGNEAVEGSVVRQTVHPIEEADQWPATRQYLDMLKKYVPDAKVAPLGIQSMSACRENFHSRPILRAGMLSLWSTLLKVLTLTPRIPQRAARSTVAPTCRH